MIDHPTESLFRLRKLQVIYDNEINASISWFWDGGFTWVLGDETNGIECRGNTHTIEEAIERLWSETLLFLIKNDNDILRVKMLRDLYQPFEIK